MIIRCSQVDVVLWKCWFTFKMNYKYCRHMHEKVFRMKKRIWSERRLSNILTGCYTIYKLHVTHKMVQGKKNSRQARRLGFPILPPEYWSKPSYPNSIQSYNLSRFFLALLFPDTTLFHTQILTIFSTLHPTPWRNNWYILLTYLTQCWSCICCMYMCVYVAL